MGVHTDFRGAIRVTPRVAEPLAGRLADFLAIRHMRRDVRALQELYPTAEACVSHSLFGDGTFGPEGEWYLPDRTGNLQFAFGEEFLTTGIEGLTAPFSSTPPKGLPNLYCGLSLVHSRTDDCSYLGWDGSEKAYSMSDWLQVLAAQLTRLGYHLDGRMFADVEAGSRYYSITVCNAAVHTEDVGPAGFTDIRATYDAVFESLSDPQ